jgi:hypothetical protein
MSSHFPVMKLGRRHFLLGAGGLALAIPHLPSLEKDAHAGGTARAPARYFCICTDHGGTWDNNYYPQNAMWGTPMAYGLQGHTVQAAPLAPSFSAGSDGKSGVSSVLRASTSAGVLTSALVAKMNLLQGLDVPWYLAHHQGGTLGNYAVNDSSGCTSNCSTSDGYNVAQLGARPTIDQIMASSAGFYATTPRAPTIPIAGAYGASQARSWAFSGAQNPSSTVVSMNDTDNSQALFNSIFTVSMGNGTKMRTPAVDRVLQNYNSLMNGNSRLSAADKFRLSQHIDMLNTLEGTLGAATTCSTTPPVPADNSAYGFYGTTPNYTKWGQLYMDVIAAAFVCNATRVATMAFGDTSLFSPSWMATSQSDWHHLAAHLWYQDTQQGYLVESYQGFFEQVFLYLAAKLDSVLDPDGNTVLDNSLLVWTQECCMETHEQYGIQTATFGSASGNLNTGLYCDYRHQNFMPAQRMPGQNQPGPASSKITSYVTWPGLLWEQWLATQLNVMQIAPSAWQLWKDSSGAVQQGYGTPYLQMDQYGLNFAPHYIPDYATGWKGGPVTMAMSDYYSNAGTSLPFLTG